MTNKDLVIAELFLKKAFKANPHYSFDNWRIMYDHSVLVKDNAVKIASRVGANKILAGLAGLLHDIGKTQKIAIGRLEAEHQDFNFSVSKPLFEQLSLNASEKRKLAQIISYKSKSKEMKAVKDADALAFYQDKRLYTIFLKWAVKNKKTTSIQKKIDKFNKLNFAYSRNIAKKDYAKMLKAWQPKLNKLR